MSEPYEKNAAPDDAHDYTAPRLQFKVTATLAKLVLEQLEANGIPSHQATLQLNPSKEKFGELSPAEKDGMAVRHFLSMLTMPMTPQRGLPGEAPQDLSVYGLLRSNGLITCVDKGGVSNEETLNLAALQQIAMGGLTRRPTIAERAAGRSAPSTHGGAVR